MILKRWAMNLLLQLTVVGKASAHLRLGRVTCLRFHLNVSSSSTGERLFFFSFFQSLFAPLKTQTNSFFVHSFSQLRIWRQAEKDGVARQLHQMMVMWFNLNWIVRTNCHEMDWANIFAVIFGSHASCGFSLWFSFRCLSPAGALCNNWLLSFN